MNAQEYAMIVANNLRRVIYESGKTPAEVSRDLGINKSTLSCWMNGSRTPKMNNIDMLCDYFGILREHLMEPDGADRVQKHLKFAGLISSLTDDEKAEVIKYIEFLISKRDR